MSDYLTAEQYEYARKTGDWESGKFLTHGQALNENQQVVLDYLTSENRLTKEAPLLSINNFSEKHFGAELPEKVETAYRELKAEEDYEILAAFADWGMKEVAE